MGFLKRFRELLSYNKSEESVRGKRIKVRHKRRGRPKVPGSRRTTFTFRINEQDKDKFMNYCERIEMTPGTVLNILCKTFNLKIESTKTKKQTDKMAKKIAKLLEED